MGEFATDLGYGHGSAVRPLSVVEPQVPGSPKDPRIPVFKKAESGAGHDGGEFPQIRRRE